MNTNIYFLDRSYNLKKNYYYYHLLLYSMVDNFIETKQFGVDEFWHYINLDFTKLTSDSYKPHIWGLWKTLSYYCLVWFWNYHSNIQYQKVFACECSNLVGYIPRKNITTKPFIFPQFYSLVFSGSPLIFLLLISTILFILNNIAYTMEWLLILVETSVAPVLCNFYTSTNILNFFTLVYGQETFVFMKFPEENLIKILYDLFLIILIDDYIDYEFNVNTTIYCILLPVVRNHGSLGPCPRPWSGVVTDRRTTAICRFRARR